MADKVEKKVLLTVDILNNFVEAKKNADDAKKALDSFIKSGEINAAKQQELATQYAKTKNELANAQKAMLSASKTQDVLGTAVEATSKTLGEMQRELSALRNTPLDAETLGESGIKEIKQRMADLTASIQDYKNEIKSLDTGEVFANAAEGVEFITASVSILSNTAKAVGADTEIFKGLQDSATELIAIMQGLGVVTEYLSKKKYNLFIANLKAVGSNIAESVAVQVLTSAEARHAIAATAATKAEAAKGVVMGKGSLITKAAAAVQWAWNAALAANPIIAVLAAAVLLIAGIGILIAVLASSSDAEKNAAKASAAYEEQQKKTALAIENANAKMNAATDKRKLALQDEILTLQKNGASAEEIAKAKAKADEDLTAISVAASKEREKAQRKELAAAQVNVDAQKALLATMDKGSDEYKEQLDKVNELIKAKNGLVQSINGEMQAQKQAAIDANDKAQKQKEDDKKAAEERIKKAQETALKLLDSQKKFADEQAKLKSLSVGKDFASQQKWAAEEFARNQAYEKEKLSMQRKFGQISAAEYKTANDVLNVQAQSFQGQQVNDVKSYYAERLKTIKDLLAKSDAELEAETSNKYDKEINFLRQHNSSLLAEYNDLAKKTETASTGDGSGMGALTEEERARFAELQQLTFENANVLVALEKEKQDEIAKIKKEAQERQLLDITQLNDAKYAEDLAKFTDNEVKKNAVEIAKIKDLIAAKKQQGLQTYADEAALRELQATQIKNNLNAELAQSNLTAQRAYDAKKQALQKEMALYKDNATKQAELTEQLAALEKERLQGIADSLTKWGGAMIDVLAGIDEVKKNNEDQELQRYEQDNEQKKTVLQERLNAGLISQDSYDKSVAKLDSDLDKKQKQLAYQQAKRQKQLAIMNAALNAAGAIIASLAQSPVAIGPIPNPAGIASLALATTMGILQVAAAASTPLPQASRGLLLNGPSHADGGIPIEAEGGEAIINKKSTARYRGLLSAINEWGGGVRFAAGGIPGVIPSMPVDMRVMYDGGYSQRAIQNESKAVTKDDMDRFTSSIENLKIYTALDDINRAENKNNVVITENN